MKENSRNEMIAVVVAIIVVIVILLIGILHTLTGNVASEGRVTGETYMDQVHGSGLITKDIVVGDGVEATPGLVVTTHYVGTLDDGTVFDSSVARGAPFSFTLGTGQVIRGWDLGVLGMKVGGKRELTIPADLAYGNREIGTIPANSTLHFVIELLEVKDGQ